MKRTMTMSLVLLVAAAASACGPKKGETKPAQTVADEAKPAGQGAGAAAATDDAPLAGAVARLNKAVQEEDEEAAAALLSSATVDVLKEIVTFSPEEAGGGVQAPELADCLAFEKAAGTVYALKDADEDEGTGTIVITGAGGAAIAEGTVTLVEAGGAKVLDFFDAVQARLEKIQTEVIARGKLLDVIEKVNKAIKNRNANLLKEAVHTDSLNLELKIRAFTTVNKKKLTLEGILEHWGTRNYVFAATDLDITAQTAKLTVTSTTDKGEKVVYQGGCAFAPEGGVLKLDMGTILKLKVNAMEEEQKEKEAKKK